MIKVSILYKYAKDATFDSDYYAGQHLPMVARLLGESCQRYEIDCGLRGAAPGSNPTYIAGCHLYAETEEKFFSAFSKVQREIMADVENYTDISPIMQVNKVRIG